ncbi:hypothetical protein CKAN_02725800 [Cinnamomum micranthum f. kanehirae]|uniref:Uncharacterized protein n=1 Tax=Cinnamomum micranthum f. kanehirae TaxID=337451 RepID=A0A3S3RAC9_9MAGN|nr:hypothetical protein CKAN_02725800 [Cinnamomum micranthum f. kanehirae]
MEGALHDGKMSQITGGRGQTKDGMSCLDSKKHKCLHCTTSSLIINWHCRFTARLSKPLLRYGRENQHASTTNWH